MTWSWIGWAIIGLSMVSLIVFSFLFKKGKSYQIRRYQAVERLKSSRVSAMERGKSRFVMLGHQLWSHTYSGLGLQALLALSPFLDAENAADGHQVVSVSDGSLLVLARQIAQGHYRGGFSKALNESGSAFSLPGPSPLSFTAAILPKLKSQSCGSLVMLGYYGPEAALWAEGVVDQNEHVFAAAGSLSSQAALLVSVRDLLIAEEVFMLPSLIEPRPMDRAGLLTEDILRIVLILLMVVGAFLKVIGVL